MQFTGKELNYLHVCHRKLWLFHHGIRPELENQLVQLGMQLGEQTFIRHEKEILIGEVGVLDWADFKSGVIHETKRGHSPGGGDEAQVSYYLYILNSHGINARAAVIHYPRKKETKTVLWNDEAEQFVKTDLVACENVVKGNIPGVNRKPYCRNCAYEEMCFT